MNECMLMGIIGLAIIIPSFCRWLVRCVMHHMNWLPTSNQKEKHERPS